MRKRNARSFSARLPVVMYCRLPTKFAKPSSLLIQDANEAPGSATMLNVRLSRRIRGREIGAVALGKEIGEIGRYVRSASRLFLPSGGTPYANLAVPAPL